MNISFKGFKNIAYQEYNNKYPKYLQTNNNRIYIPTLSSKVFHAVLNNETENDLDEFKSVLEEYPDTDNSSALNVEYTDLYEGKIHLSKIQINGKEVELNDDTLKTFIKIHKAIKKIAAIPLNKLVLDDYYYQDDSAFNPFINFLNLINVSEFANNLTNNNANYIVNLGYRKEIASEGAKRMRDKLSDDLKDFFLNNK